MRDLRMLFNIPLQRRHFLKIAGLSALLSSFASPRIAWGQTEDFELFMKLSAYLTGRQTLDRSFGQRLFTTLTSLDKSFAARLKQLNAYTASNIISVENLQANLDRNSKDLAELPKLILNGWYLGVAGNRVCITYENALMFTPVQETLVIPSYSPHRFGYWKEAPILEENYG